jgi:hypothetical protein
MIKAPDIGDPSHFIPAIMVNQLVQNFLQGDAVKRTVAMLVSHVLV